MRSSLNVFNKSSLSFAYQKRKLSTTIGNMTQSADYKPLPSGSIHVADQTKDVWSIVNETAAATEAETGVKVVNLGQGFFSYGPPQFAVDAAKRALDNPHYNQYSPSKGQLPLRVALSEAYSPYFGRKIDPDSEIVVTAGANEGMYAAFTGFLSPGDEVITFEPFFDQYVADIALPGGVLVPIPLHPPPENAHTTCSSAEWRVDMDEFKAAITPRTKMIVLNSPHNPVGKVFSSEELEAIGKLAVEHNIIILSDEVYDRLYYKKFVRIGSLSPEIDRLTITVGSAGKTFRCTGWRVGWLMGHKDLMKNVLAAHTRIVFCVNTPFQIATADAFNQAQTNDYFKSHIDSFKHKYELFYKVWDELGLPYTKPEGGYFLLVNFAQVQIPEDYKFPDEVTVGRTRDYQLAYWLIKEFGVVAIPPSDFYSKKNAHIAQNYLRFAVCKDDEILEEAHRRLLGLKKFIKN
jgi:kynurenine aminotransferase